MASEGAASSVLGANMTMNSGVSTTPFMAPVFPLPSAGHKHRASWKPHLQPLMTPTLFPDHLLGHPALPRTFVMAGEAGQGLIGSRARNTLGQVRLEWGQPEPLKMQTTVFGHGLLDLKDPGVLCGSTVCPTPQLLEGFAEELMIPTSALETSQTSEGSRRSGHLPQGPPQASQMAPVILSVNSGPWTHGAPKEGVLAVSQSKTAPDDFSDPKNVYEGFRHWQCFRALAGRHLPQGPDAGALSCFLIPVLRSLSHLEPAMTLEEGIRRAMQDWQHQNNSDRMPYYAMAEKFMEFEAKEEKPIRELQFMKGVQHLPPPAPVRPEAMGTPAQEVVPQPVCILRKDVSKAQTPCSPQGPRGTKASDEISPEVLETYIKIMEELLRPAPSVTGEPGVDQGGDSKESQEEQDATYQDPGLLSYVEELCSKEDFLMEVEDVIHYGFLEEFLSPEAQVDPFILAEVLLVEEKGLTPVQLVQKQHQASKEKVGVQAPLSDGVPPLDSRPSESVTGQDAQKSDLGPQLGVKDRAHPPAAGQADVHVSRPKPLAVSSGCQEYPLLQAPCLPSTPQGHRNTSSGLGHVGTSIPRESTLVRDPHRPAENSPENEEDLPSLAFLSASPESLLPYAFSLSPVSASGPASTRICGPQGAVPSQSQKRKCDQFVTGSGRKRQRSQYGTTVYPPAASLLGGPYYM